MRLRKSQNNSASGGCSGLTEPRFREVTPADPVAYVLSPNLEHRHLTGPQKILVGDG
jgi:hypothetical protein